jgi:radical SAM protein with 4Fe4S-binding SPASM domain
MNGISTINIELTSRCNKDCSMCGRRQLEKTDPEYASKQGDMDWRTFMQIIDDLEPGMIVQLHWNGEPTLYHNLKDAAVAAKKIGCIVSMNTNALTLGDMWKECADLDSITCSIIQGDSPENYSMQYRQISKFLKETARLPMKPIIVLRFLGKVPVIGTFTLLAREYPGRVISAPRVLHAPDMSRVYERRPTVPEIGLCLDLLTHLAIDRHGDVYPCVRMNPDGINCLGNVSENSLFDMINGDDREEIIRLHLEGRRNEVPLCQACHYWGCPTSP